MRDDRPRDTFVLGFASGLGVGLLLLAVAGVAVYFNYQRLRQDARRGWKLQPVVVAAFDLKPGTMVSLDNLNSREVPEQFVTSSAITPSRANEVLGQPLRAPVRAGDVLLWSMFSADAGDPPGSTRVLFLVRDVVQGNPLTPEDLAEHPVDERLVTTSWLPATQRPKVLGRVLRLSLRAGDPLLEAHLLP